jgi:hypothetical protein
MGGTRRGGRAATKPARRPDPPPLEIDESKVIAIGSAAWVISLIVMLIFYGKLEDNDREWWIWTAVAGLGLGLWGWVLVRRRVEARQSRTPRDD